MAYGVFWVNEGIIDSHDVDLTMLDTIMAVRTKSGADPKSADDEPRLTHYGRPIFPVSDADQGSRRGERALTHQTTDSAKTVDADFGNHG